MTEPRHPGVFERNGKWWVRLPTGTPGKYRREAIGTYEQAVLAYQLRGAGTGPTLLEAMERTLQLRPAGGETYRSHLKYFDGRFPEIKLREFAKLDNLRAWQTERAGNAAPASVNHMMAFLSVVFQQAIEDGHMVANPIGGKGPGRLRYLKAKNGRTRWLYEDEEKLLREHLGEFTWEAVEFAVHTGLRRGEQWALEWSDWTGDTLWVEAAKTEQGRTCFLNEVALEILRKRKARGLERPFPFMSAKGMSATFNNACRKLGLEGLSWHCLRHTTGTRMVRQGVSTRVIQRVLGHQSVAVTERYTHVEDDQLRAAVADLGRRNTGEPAFWRGQSTVYLREPSPGGLVALERAGPPPERLGQKVRLLG